jgi:hypothetical protein
MRSAGAVNHGKRRLRSAGGRQSWRADTAGDRNRAAARGDAREGELASRCRRAGREISSIRAGEVTVLVVVLTRRIFPLLGMRVSDFFVCEPVA